MSTDTAAGDAESSQGASLLDWCRWIGALAAVAGAAFLVVGSHYESSLQVCEFNAEVPSKELCKPYPVEAVIPLLILALALMWRDLSEVSISGLGSIVRRIDNNQQKLQEGQAELQGKLTMIQTQTLNNNLYFELQDASEQVRMREPELAAQTEQTPTAWSDLEEAWEKLEPWSRLAMRLRDPYFREFLRAGDLDAASLENRLAPSDRTLILATHLESTTDVQKAEAWASAAHSRLELVRKVIRGGQSLPDLQVKQALAVSRDLLSELVEAGLETGS